MNINNILPYRLFSNKIESNSPYSLLQGNSKRTSDYSGARNPSLGDNFSYANYSVEKLLKDRNLNIDEKNMSATNELLKNEVPATRENILRMVDIRNKIDSIVNEMSYEAANELAQANSFTDDIDQLSSAMKRITESLMQNPQNTAGNNITGNADGKVSDEAVDKAVKQVFGSEADSGKVDEKDRLIIRQLLAEGIPVTLKNVQTVRNYTSTIQELGSISADSIAITAGSGVAATPQALANAEAYISAYAGQGGLSEEQVANLEGEISRILGNYGIEPTKENIEAAKALIRNQVDVTEKNIRRYMEISDTVDELVKLSGAEAGAKLLKQDVRTEAYDVVKLLAKIKGDRLMQQQNRAEASEMYEKMETTRLHNTNMQVISNKDLKAMEKDIIRILEAAGIETKQDNIEAAKALIRNNMEITQENIDKFNKLLKVFTEAENIGSVKTEASIFQGSDKINTDQIKSVLEVLKSSGDAIQFLEGSSSQNYAQLEHLLTKIEGIRSTNYTAVAFLMRNELPVNIRNASIAFSMIKPGVNNFIDLKMDRQLDMGGRSLILPQPFDTGALASKSAGAVSSKTSIPLAYNQSDISLEEFTNISKALAQNTLPINKGSVLRAYEIQSSIYNVSAAAQEKEGRQVIQKLLDKGISVEDYEITELEALMKGEGSQEEISAEGILQKVSQLKGVTDSNISLAMKYGIPMNIDKLSQLKLIMENRSSLGKELAELESLLGKEKTDKIKAILPKTDLKELKNGKDISEIYNEINEKIKALEKESVSWTSAARGDLLKITGRIKENLEVQNYLNQDQAYMQLPVIYHDKPTHLQVFVNDRHKGRKGLEEAENLDVVLNLETENFGLLDIRMNIRERSVDLGIKVDDSRQKRKLDAVLEKLSERISKAGFKTRDITCEMRQEEIIPVEKSEKSQPQSIKRVNSTGRFEIRI